MSDSRSRAVVIVGHGSRRPAAAEYLEGLARQLTPLIVGAGVSTTLRVAHLELSTPLLPEVLDACARDGFREVVIHPFLLGPGRHLEVDVPEALAAARARHPGVSFRQTRALGESPELLDAVLARICESLDDESA